MSKNKHVFYCAAGDHAPLAFIDSRGKRNCPECKEPMIVTDTFSVEEEEAEETVENSEE